MKIAATDYWLMHFCSHAKPLLKWLGDCESRWLSERLSNLEIRRPIYISGLARSGSTILLETFAKLPELATHRYRDFPFWQIPYYWHQFLEFQPRITVPVERPHRDGIMITRDSPEAMEEPLWTCWFPNLHRNQGIHHLGPQTSSPGFERFYADHIRKLLLIRNGQRYLAKNNYLLPRATYLWRLFEDAELIIPIRHPLSHVPSLVRQHSLFTAYAQQEARVAEYLTSVGHYEFGPQRVPIRLDEHDSQRVNEQWRIGNEFLGYAIQWKQLYALAWQLKQSTYNPRIHILRLEDLSSQPCATLSQLLQQLQISVSTEQLNAWSSKIHPLKSPADLNHSQRQTIWHEVNEIAQHFGYGVDLDTQPTVTTPFFDGTRK